MVDVVLQCAWALYRVNQDDDDESLSPLTFRRHVLMVDYPRAMSEFEIFHQMSPMMTQNITRCNLNTGVLRTPLSI